MKSTLLRSFLEWALITSVLMSVGFFGWYWIKTRAIRDAKTQIEVAQIDINNNHNVIGILLTESQAYGRTNADMAKLLAPAPAAAVKPGVK